MSNASPPSPPTAAVPAELPIRALVVEDNADLSLILTTRLRMMGLEVSASADGKSAVESAAAARAQGRPFDLVLMDMELPILDGCEAARRLRRQGHVGPILAMSAHAPAEIGDWSRFGCDGHISKPIDWDSLGAAVAKLTPRTRLRTPADE